MGQITSWFGGGNVSAFVDRARKRLAAGKLEDAAKVVERGLQRFPDSASLLDLRLSIKRARAHDTMRRLEGRIARTSDAIAYEELIELYRELELPDEARRKAAEYCEAHPNRDTPHLVLGDMDLATFLEELSARHGHSAQRHLMQAASLNALALQPRVLLAELYFCIGADRSLAPIRDSLHSLAPETEAMQAALQILDAVASPNADENLDGLFEKIEFGGELLRDPADWPLSRRRAGTTRVNEDRAQPVVDRLMNQGLLDEVVLIRRDGTLVTHGRAGQPAMQPGGAAIPPASTGHDFVDVVRTASRKVFTQAREFDMGKFNRCTIRGAFGNVVVGRVGNVMVGVRGACSIDPLRMWERISVELESVCGGAA